MLIIAGGATIGGVAYVTHFSVSSMETLQWVFYAAGGVSLSSAAALLFGKPKTLLPGGEDHPGEPVFEQEKKEFQRNREAAEAELEKLAADLQKKQQILNQRLMTLQEWLEFPIEFTDPDEKEPPPDVEFYQKDRQVFELLEHETELLFEKIKKNHYIVDETFQRTRLIQDVLDVVESVAKVYQPESQNPLLETSIEKLLRAVNRTSIQLLVFMEAFPIDIKNYNLRSGYDLVRRGVKAYDVYKAAQPYWTYVRPVYYFGRFTLGANPLTLGIGWAASEMVKTGVQKLSVHFANRYAMGLLHDMVFIVGNEAAGVFGGDYRHRDVYWTYGAELTELVHRFPVSREILMNALNEVNVLLLRSEYDRVFLYRCLAAHKSAQPERFEAKNYLSIDDRKTIAVRLEKFYTRYIHGSEKVFYTWKRDVEFRLDIKLLLDSPVDKAMSGGEEAMVSLAAFLMEVKGRRVEALPEILTDTRVFTVIGRDEKPEIIRKIVSEPPMIFEFPDIDPGNPLVDHYLDDLSRLDVRFFPYAAGEPIVLEAAKYFRKNLNDLQKDVDRRYTELIRDQLSPESPEKKLKPEVAYIILSILEEDEMPRAVYKNIDVIDPDTRRKLVPSYRETWMLITERRMVLVAVNLKIKEKYQTGLLMWSADKNDDLNIELIQKRFKNEIRITGGHWQWDDISRMTVPPLIRVAGERSIKKHTTYFQFITDFKNA